MRCDPHVIGYQAGNKRWVSTQSDTFTIVHQKIVRTKLQGEPFHFSGQNRATWFPIRYSAAVAPGNIFVRKVLPGSALVSQQAFRGSHLETDTHCPASLPSPRGILVEFPVIATIVVRPES